MLLGVRHLIQTTRYSHFLQGVRVGCIKEGREEKKTVVYGGDSKQPRSVKDLQGLLTSIASIFW